MFKQRIYLIQKNKITELEAKDLTLDTIGGKAMGLCEIPNAWSVPFFIVSKDLFSEYIATNSSSVVSPYVNKIKDVINILGLNGNIILRSSAIDEGMEERGKFDSIETNINSIEDHLFDLLERLKGIPNKGMPIIVQQYLKPHYTGHMSNERRFSKENRDWVYELYYPNGISNQDTLGIRKWRKKYNSKEIIQYPLQYDTTNSKEQLKEQLYKIAYYWYELSKKNKYRFHLEFVCNENTIYVVQADKAEQNSDAVNPLEYDIRIKRNQTDYVFNVLVKYDPKLESPYKKLQNVKNYNDLGFCTVPLYYLADQSILSRIREGEIPDELIKDLSMLLSIQSVIIRMDIKSNDKSRKQMLPRSNELYDIDSIIGWIKDNISSLPQELSGILIFHNYVPSISSAFAHATPNGRLVRIQSLWGIPEGLYYNYHDTTIVDLSSKPLDSLTDSDIKVSVKTKFKDTFITPNDEGQWVAKEIKEPFDWKCSLLNNSSIFEIAVKSQRLANKLQKEISIMWFVGIDKSYFNANNLPWFHESISIKNSYTVDEYKRKSIFDEEIIVNNSNDFKAFIESDSLMNKKCVRIKPSCDADLRNRDLLKAIGKLAKEHNITILLDGTQLTHSYYQLKNTGANVVCSNKDELVYSDSLEFNKLVRDRIPEKINSNGEYVICSKIMRPSLDRLLLEKLLEEAFEVYDATIEESVISELADMLEVCNAIEDINNDHSISWKDLLNNLKPRIHNASQIEKKIVLTNSVFASYSFKIGNVYANIKVQRKKTNYRTECIIQNQPFLSSEDGVKQNITYLQEKEKIISKVSLIQMAKSSSSIMSYIRELKQMVFNLCQKMNVSKSSIYQIMKEKKSKAGGFKNGYVLFQTTLKDNIIDSSLDFEPENCNSIYRLNREQYKQFDFLQDLESNDEKLLFRFDIPIAVNSWEIAFDNAKINRVIPGVQFVLFYLNKKGDGSLEMTIRIQEKYRAYKQLSLFDSN